MVDGLRQGLTAAEHEVWLDREQIKGGQEWWNRITAAIAACDAMIVAVSPTMLRSAPADAERRYAEQLGKPVIPVMVALCSHHALPPDLARTDVVDYTNPGPAAAFQLVGALTSLPSPEAPAQPPSKVQGIPPPPISETADLRARIMSPTLTLDEQLSLVGRLRTLIRSNDDELCKAARELLIALRSRGDVVFDEAARQIDDLLRASGDEQPRNRAVAGLLAVFLGFLGIYNFYLGKYFIGGIQLALTVLTGGYGIFLTVPWSWIDAVIIFLGGGKDSSGRPLV